MNKWITGFVMLLITGACTTTKQVKSENGWIDLFNKRSLDGWRASENPATFSVENGMIVVHGPRAHLFYNGPIKDHHFKDFELSVKVMTTPGSNSGIFIHTQYQQTGWPSKGYEIQVNNSQSDWRRTGSLYGIQDVKEVHVKDNEWFTESIMVKGKRIVIKINDKIVVDYTEPVNAAQFPDRGQKFLSGGTIALQGHDPDSKVYFKEIKLKVL